MRTILLTLLIGALAGLADVLPMIKMKVDKHSTASAFVHYLIAPFIIFNIELFDMPWWLKGGAVTLLLAVPVMILVARDDKKSVVPMVGMSIILGTLIGIAGHFVL